MLQYPDVYLGKAMDAFISNLTWDSGNSDGQYYVNAYGEITVFDTLSNVEIQYLVNMDNETFSYNAIRLNGIEQSSTYYKILEYKVMDNYLYGDDTYENLFIQAVKNEELIGYPNVPLDLLLRTTWQLLSGKPYRI